MGVGQDRGQGSSRRGHKLSLVIFVFTCILRGAVIARGHFSGLCRLEATRPDDKPTTVSFIPPIPLTRIQAHAPLSQYIRILWSQIVDVLAPPHESE